MDINLRHDAIHAIVKGDFYIDENDQVIVDGEIFLIDEDVFLRTYTHLEHVGKIENLKSNIKTHIYSSYPAEKQPQDEKWASSYTTKLKGAGVADLERTVIFIVSQQATKPINSSVEHVIGGLADAVLASIQGNNTAQRKDYASAMLTKLVTIASRTEWVEVCVREGKAAIVENREPEYPQFV